MTAQQPNPPTRRRDSSELPAALGSADLLADVLAEELRGRRLALFLDYDGTLTPIVERPEDATLPPATRDALRRLARRCPVAVVSGRGLDDVRALVDLDQVYYAGSHGFRIAGPDGSRTTHEAGQAFLPAVDRAENELLTELRDIDGASVERKDVAVAVHFRRVAPARRDEVIERFHRVAAAHDKLATSRGKMVLELRPDLDWDKGQAVLWLLRALDLDDTRTLPVFIGDDTTDEDAFAALQGRGIGILVRDEPRPTAAQHALEDPRQVRRFLEALEHELAREPRR